MIDNSNRLAMLSNTFQYGANVNAVDLWQYTALHEAASKGRQEVCSCLLAHGADPTLKNGNLKTALDLAQTPELHQLILSKFTYSFKLFKVRVNTIRTDLELTQYIVSIRAQFQDWLSRTIQPIMELRTCKNYKLR